MDLALSTEQVELVTSFGDLLAAESSVDRVRAAEPGGFDEALWQTLLDTGALTMGVPEEQGGWGATMIDLVLVAEQLGRALAAAPAIEAQVAARLLGSAASAQSIEALQVMLAGEQFVSLALRSPESGVMPLVPAGGLCDAVLALDGQRLLLAPVRAEERRPVANLAAAPLADLTCDLDRASELANGAEAIALFEGALDEWLLLVAAAVVGAAASAHEAVCVYAAERRAFGGVIGSYQGVAHPLADDATALDGARLLTLKAAWALDTKSDRARELVAMAFAFGSETALQVTYDAIHFHGGYGFMLEHDMQLHYRRVRGWSRVWGGPDRAYRRAADARYPRGA
jgi:alkylation response protein AidB-like acyl-CoA dehydrogenase